MSLLQRMRILSDERLDKYDLDNMINFIGSDFNAMFKNIFASSSYIVSGFQIYKDSSSSDTNPVASPVYVGLANSVLIHSSATSGSMMYVGSSSLQRSSIAIISNATNYIELDLSTESAGPDTRVFWDRVGEEEYTQIIDTVQNLIVSVTVNTTGWSGGTKVPLAKIVTTGSTITSIKDYRSLLYRLNSDYTWSTRVEPDQDRKNDSTAFTGADKSIATLKNWMDASMSRIKELSGMNYWYEQNTDNVVKISEDRNIFLADGGTIAYLAGSLSWSSDLFVVHPFRGTFIIPSADSPIAVSDGDVIYVKLNRSQRATADATAGGYFYCEDGTKFVDGDRVFIGDSDTTGVSGYILGAPSGNTVLISSTYPASTPIDLHFFTKAKGAFIVNKELTLVKDAQNTGDLRPNSTYTLDSDVFVIGQRISTAVYFRDGRKFS